MIDDFPTPTKPLDITHVSTDEHYVVVRVGGDYSVYPLPRAGRVVIGRSSGCDIRIDHPTVSRRHAEIVLGEGVTVRDLDSANGTRVLDVAVASDRPMPVELGQPIHIGGATVLVQQNAIMGPAGPPTGSRYVQVRLEEECARAERSRGRFAYAVMEIHGTAPIGEVEQVLANELRVSDVVAATSPTEYELLLPDATSEQASAAIERIVLRLRDRGVHVVTGMSRYPDDGRTTGQLVARARTRLRERADASLGASPRPPWRELIERVADSNISVLIRGETGVGKELCAAELHRLSSRREQPFLKLNCAAFSETLLESELFGYERGAFTGAMTTKPGLLETAHGGTVFLDEVGDLPPALQAKLLRVLEDRQVLRVGALEPRTVDVRFVSATNRPIEDDIEQRRFRSDLLYRLGGVTVHIPPLRERLHELEGLASAFVASACTELRRRDQPALSREALAALHAYEWPGNIRELRNAIERAVLLCGGGPIQPLHLPLAFDGAADGPPDHRATQEIRAGDAGRERARRASLNDELATVERKQILDALERCGGNQTRAARLLGIARGTLQKRMDEYGIPRPRKK